MSVTISIVGAVDAPYTEVLEPITDAVMVEDIRQCMMEIPNYLETYRFHQYADGSFADIKRVKQGEWPELNLNTANFDALTAVLGVRKFSGHWGDLPAQDIPALLRAILRVRNTRSKNALVEKPWRDGRFMVGGRTSEQVLRYLDRLEAIAMAAASKGVGITWD